MINLDNVHPVGNPLAEARLACGHDHCTIDECLACGERDCPHAEPLHYHHDGCPACDIPEAP